MTQNAEIKDKIEQETQKRLQLDEKLKSHISAEFEALNAKIDDQKALLDLKIQENMKMNINLKNEKVKDEKR